MMSGATESDARAQANAEKGWVAATSVGAAVVLTGGKLIVGLGTNSLGILSEAAHSGLDLVAAVVTFWAVRASGRPADVDHTYGHGKIENLSALFETLLLLLTCVWIVWEASRRLLGAEQVHVDATFWAFAVVIASIVIDFSRSRALKRVADKYDSQALEADALHFSTDIWSSGVVLGGLICVRVGAAYGVPWLNAADAVAALGVAVIVVWVSLRLGKKSIDTLLDKVPSDLREKVAQAAKVAGVHEVRQVRVRRVGPEHFADITLTTGPDAGLERVHDIATQVETAVGRLIPRADVVVHVEPANGEEDQVPTEVRRLAHKHGVQAHAIQLKHVSNEQHLELHLEVPASLKVNEAHALATAFEAEVLRTMPSVSKVVTHLEPVGVEAALRDGELADASRVRVVLEGMAAQVGCAWSLGDLVVTQVDGQLEVAFACALDGSESICTAHEVTERVERELRARVPGVGKVVIHVEPRK